MKYGAPQEIIDNTTECPFEFSCLSTGKCDDFDLCEALNADGELATILKSELKPEVVEGCPFAHAFRYVHVCNCPVRSYLCKEYGV